MPEKANGGDHPWVDATSEQQQYLDEQKNLKTYLARSVFEAERDAVKKRRDAIKSVRDRTEALYTGIALSGGGIRSASFGLGVLHALQATHHGIEGIDYLSTVSGGGYIGCSLTAALQKTKGEFPFTAASERADTAAVRHIRDFSNYLIPHGALDAVTALGIIGRGIVANVLIIAPILLFFVWFTLLNHPTKESLHQPIFFTANLAEYFPSLKLLWRLPGFWITIILGVINLLFLIIWAFAKSVSVSQFWQSYMTRPRGPRDSAELNGGLALCSKILFFVTVLFAALDLQPYLLSIIACAGDQGLDWFSGFKSYLVYIGTVLAPAMGALFAFFSKYLTDVITSAKQATGWMASFKRIAAKAALWFAAIIVPVCLWLLYLRLTYIGLDDSFAWWLYLVLFITTAVLAAFINPNATSLYRLYRDRLSKAFLFDPQKRQEDEPRDLEPNEPKLHAIQPELCPYPIVNAALNIEGSQYANQRGRNADFFIFTPEYVGSGATGYIGTRRIEKEEAPQRNGEGGIQLSEKKRFKWIDKKDAALDLGTAMAISGAAVSSNMGSLTIKPLAFTLALLNVRLGYWLRNPIVFREDAPNARLLSSTSIVPPTTPERSPKPTSFNSLKKSFDRRWSLLQKRILELLWSVPNYFLFMEMFGWITEASPKVYLTDGGHIENLGVYSLMKRGCDVIIAIDAEADPGMGFGALLTLERYARIDLGVTIDLPWQDVRNHSLEIDKAFEEADKDRFDIPRLAGPHCAACEIDYGSKKGILLYVKASLSGDEADYILDYKRRHRAFPYETTSDQFFGEEQLEVYRALGFHIMSGLLTNPETIAVKGDAKRNSEEKRKDILHTLHTALLGA